MTTNGYHTCWRIEHPSDGKGPYQGSTMGGTPLDYFRMEIAAKHSDVRHPLPKFDGIPGVHPSDVCGFFDLESFFAWFDLDERQQLTDHGFELVAYSVLEDDISSLGYSGQCFFFRHHREDITFRGYPNHFDPKGTTSVSVGMAL